jgi:hypothetical protein
MRTWKTAAKMLAVGLLGGLGLCAVAADEAPKAAEPGTLVVLDAAGKGQKLKTWEFTAGTRRLSWLAPAPDKKDPEPREAPAEEGRPGTRAKPRPAAGPEALEFLDETQIKYLPAVLTLIPLDRIRSIDFDNDKDTMTVRVATGADPEKDEVLTGSTRYRGLNKLILEADVDRGDAGVAAIKLQGGNPKGIRGIRFPPPKVGPAAPAGRPAVVTSADGTRKKTHKVSDLQPLYRLAGGGERLLPTLMFKKTLKVDVAKVARIVAPENEGTRDGLAWQVTQKGGEDETLTLLQDITHEGKKAALEGLLGRVPAGYRLFPPSTIAEVKFDAAEDAKRD